METQRQTTESRKVDIVVRPLQESDLATADHIMRLAFGTFIGLPEPTTFMGDAAMVRARWLADPAAAYGAETNGELVGSNFAAHWGSVGFFGPLTVHPTLWDQGVATRLMEPIMDLFTQWGIKQAGLFTFAQSPKHLSLYQKFGFWPRFLTAIMGKPVKSTGHESQWTRFSALLEKEREGYLRACRELTDTVYEGLDVTGEILAVATQELGDTILLWDHGKLTGLAVCHCGAGTEAGGGTCYIKFGAVRPGPTAEHRFLRLLDACEELAATKGLARIVAGVNTARHAAYRQMLARGFRLEVQGVAMHRPNEAGYNRPDVYLIDDWR